MIVSVILDIAIFLISTCCGGLVGGSITKTRKGFIAGCVIGILVGTLTIWWGQQQIKAQCENKSGGLMKNYACENSHT